MVPMREDKKKEVVKEEKDHNSMLKEQNVYELVDVPKGYKVINNHWAFDIKPDSRKHTCLIAKGFSQVEGIDFDHMFSPVLRF